MGGTLIRINPREYAVSRSNNISLAGGAMEWLSKLRDEMSGGSGPA
jgi:hypothetical protein